MPSSGNVNQVNRANTKVQSMPTFVTSTMVINFVLCALAMLLVVLYVVKANSLAAQSYKLGMLQDKLASLNERNSELVAQKNNGQDDLVLAQFAQTHNMVPAKNITYIFENGNVALR